MKRIAIDARIFAGNTGGIGRYARNLIKELAKIDKENSYTVILTPEGEKEYVNPGSNFQPQVVDIPHFSYAEQIKLPKILKQGKFDLVHFTNFNHPILYRGPFVATIHDMIMHMFPGSFQRGSILHRKAYELTFNDCKRAKKKYRA